MDRAVRRSSLVYLAGALGGGNVISSILRLAGVLLQGRFVGPEVLGLFSGISLVHRYAPFLQLGILNGLNRELPYFVGKGDRARVRELAAAAQAWALAVSAVVGTVLAAVAGWYLVQGAWELAAGWGTNALTIFALFYGVYYLQMTYRTSHDFARLAMINVVQNGLALALVVLVALLAFYGLCLRAVLSGMAGLALLYWWRPIHVGPRWDPRSLVHLLWIGLPIFIVGQIYSWWAAIDHTLVLWWTGKEGMGLYYMAFVAWETLDLLPIALAQVLYPRMAEQYGRTGRMSGLLTMCVRPMLLMPLLMLVVIVPSWFLAGPAVRLALPKYVDAVPAMQWSLLIPFLTSCSPIMNVFNVVRRQDLYLASMLLGMATYAGSLFWLFDGSLPLPQRLIAFPQAMAMGRLVFLAFGCVFLVYLEQKDRHIARG